MVCGRLREEFQLSKFGFGGIDRSTLYESFVSKHWVKIMLSYKMSTHPSLQVSFIKNIVTYRRLLSMFSTLFLDLKPQNALSL